MERIVTVGQQSAECIVKGKYIFIERGDVYIKTSESDIRTRFKAGDSAFIEQGFNKLIFENPSEYEDQEQEIEFVIAHSDYRKAQGLTTSRKIDPLDVITSNQEAQKHIIRGRSNRKELIMMADEDNDGRVWIGAIQKGLPISAGASFSLEVRTEVQITFEAEADKLYLMEVVD